MHASGACYCDQWDQFHPVVCGAALQKIRGSKVTPKEGGYVHYIRCMCT